MRSLRSESEAAFERWRHSLELSRSIPDTAGIGRTLGNFGAGFYAVGNADSARSTCGSVRVRRRRGRRAHGGRRADESRQHPATRDGDLPRAAELYATSLDHLARTGDARFKSANQHNLALVSMALGTCRPPARPWTKSIRLSRLHGYPEDEAEGLSSLADVALAEGEYDEADAMLADEPRPGAVHQQPGGGGRRSCTAADSCTLPGVSTGPPRRTSSGLSRSTRNRARLGRDGGADRPRIALAAMGAVSAGLELLTASPRVASSLRRPRADRRGATSPS